MNDLPFLPSRRLLTLADFYERAEWSRTAADFARDHALPLDEVQAHAGLFSVCYCRFESGRRFDFDDAGSAAAVVEVLAEDAATVIDLVAWPLADPLQFATALGEADLAGIQNVRNPASYASGRALRVWRTPLRWLQAGCNGVAILSDRFAGHWLSQALGPVVAEDMEHGRDLRQVLGRRFDPARLLVPTPRQRRAVA